MLGIKFQLQYGFVIVQMFYDFHYPEIAVRGCICHRPHMCSLALIQHPSISKTGPEYYPALTNLGHFKTMFYVFVIIENKQR